MTATELRAALGTVSATELARRLGLSRRLVTYWLSGARPIPRRWAEAIPRALAAGRRCPRCGQLLPNQRR